MFGSNMKKEALPERVFALCKAVGENHIEEKELKNTLVPSNLNGDSNYYNATKIAAQQLNLIIIKENKMFLADESVITSIDSMKEYIIKNIEDISDGMFYSVTKEFLNLSDEVLKYKSVTDDELKNYMKKSTNLNVTVEDMRAWRFWVSFLGFGYIQKIGFGYFVIPGMYSYLYSVLKIIKPEINKKYLFSDFINLIKPYCNVAFDKGFNERKLNYAISTGLRILHDEGKIELICELDAREQWFLYYSKLHSIVSPITAIIFRG